MALGEMEEWVVVDADTGCIGAEIWCVGDMVKGTAARVEDGGTGILYGVAIWQLTVTRK